MRARSVLAAAEDLARAADAAVIGSDHLAAGLMAEPDGLAAKAIVALGVSARQLRAAPGLPEATATAEGEPSAERVPLGPGAVAALMAALRQALHLGHNYIGTEHILLGLVDGQDGTAATLAGLGVTKPAAEQQLAAAFAALQASRNQPGSG
jgi:ATP-dependent Clp protease ATP-binding subunit ClpA